MKEHTEASRSITRELGSAARNKVFGIFLIHFEHSKVRLQVILRSSMTQNCAHLLNMKAAQLDRRLDAA